MKALAPTLAAPVLLGSCLYTEPIIAPDEEQLSPSVAFNATIPVLDTPLPVDPLNQTSVPFQILVIEDPNVGDDLYVRWFVDGDTTLYGEEHILPTGSVARSGDIGVNLDVEAFGAPPVPGTHRVEAIVSDKPFATPANDPVAGNRDPDATANVHYLFWEVRVP